MSMGYVGSDDEEEFEFDDDTTEADIEKEWNDWAWSHIEGTYTKVT